MQRFTRPMSSKPLGVNARHSVFCLIRRVRFSKVPCGIPYERGRSKTFPAESNSYNHADLMPSYFQ